VKGLQQVGWEEAMVSDLSEAALRIADTFAFLGLEPPRAVYVPPKTGMVLKSLRGAQWHSDPPHPDPDYCCTINGLAFHMDRR
jgi:hypothetical protein